MTVLSPSSLFDGEGINENISVRIEGGRIAEVIEGAPPDALKLDGLLAPGFLDIQVNGGGGVLFNDEPSVKALKTISAAHARFGVTGFMATFISDERDRMAQAIEAVAQAMAEGVPGLMGLHLEGPWLSNPKRGVHLSKFLRPLDPEDLRLITRKHAFPVLVTLAPEGASAEIVKTIAQSGIAISIGHTAASSEEVEAALDAGAACFTHLFNGMPPMEGRTPGAVGAALGRKDAWAGLILDGIHVHPASARAAFAAKTAKKLILISDAMATIGSNSPSMSLFGETITVRDGALRTADGTLAGAHLELSTAVRNAVRHLKASTEEALRMASLTPAQFLRLDHDRGRIARGARADFVLLGPDLTVRETWIAGARAA